MSKVFFLGIVALIIFLLDLYVFQALRVWLYESSITTRKVAYAIYWGLSLFTISLFFLYNFTDLKAGSRLLGQVVLFWIFAHVISKMFGSFFLLFDDAWRLIQWIGIKMGLLQEGAVIVPQEIAEIPQETTAFTQDIGHLPRGNNHLPQDSADISGEAATLPNETASLPKETAEGPKGTVADKSTGEISTGKISRSQFLAKSALVATAVPVLSMGLGILSGAHDYRIHRHIIKLPNLPKAFDGIRIAQLSDIHTGSFFNKTAVKGGVEMLLREKPDLVFFTGDLVNNVASEVKDYIDVFAKVSAPLGVYSILGNHDYGDYVNWPSREAKQQNMKDIFAAHKALGWNLMINEHKLLHQGADSIAILGVENYGKGNFPKYGKLSQAYKGTENIPVKLLLSHDPSHWEMEVIPDYKDIDLMLAGHTHGMQFGIEVGKFKWSPVQYMYPQWADLYRQGQQYLYVNRGFGFIGYPGRIGILPEITIIELQSV